MKTNYDIHTTNYKGDEKIFVQSDQIVLHYFDLFVALASPVNDEWN